MKQVFFALYDGLEWLMLAVVKLVLCAIKWTLTIFGWFFGDPGEC